MNETIKIHVIDENSDEVICRIYRRHVPDVNDEIRLGGEENEKFYKVTRRVWAFDEPPTSMDRVNVGVIRVIDDGEQ